jgi:hypothetical protein
LAFSWFFFFKNELEYYWIQRVFFRTIMDVNSSIGTILVFTVQLFNQN